MGPSRLSTSLSLTQAWACARYHHDQVRPQSKTESPCRHDGCQRKRTVRSQERNYDDESEKVGKAELDSVVGARIVSSLSKTLEMESVVSSQGPQARWHPLRTRRHEVGLWMLVLSSRRQLRSYQWPVCVLKSRGRQVLTGPLSDEGFCCGCRRGVCVALTASAAARSSLSATKSWGRQE